MTNENTHRDFVKDAIRPILDEYAMKDVPSGAESVLDETTAEIADAVFEALGITDVEQDTVDGHFRLHDGGKCHGRDEQGNLIPVPYDESGEFNSTVLTSGAKKSDYREMYPDEVNAYTKRSLELGNGAKYTSSDFKAFSVGKRVTETGGWYVTLQTPICKYGQAYDKDVTLDEAKTNFVNKYYMIYIDDYERSTGQVD